jgi:GTP-binding protein HflX
MWTHLSRYEGGIGMRGPGETQLEEDKRIIARRIQKLERDLEDLEGRKETSFLHRRGEYVVALVGYTNAGKSTLLNRLTGSDELVEDKLFATLDTRVRRWSIEEHRFVLLTDTVGFIRDLPPHLVASFHATLAETKYADLLFHVVDGSSTEALQHMRTVREVLAKIECADKDAWIVFNKWDAVSPDRRVEVRQLAEAPGQPSFTVSARTGEGLDELRRALVERIHREDEEIEVLIPHDRGDLVSYVRENGRLVSSAYETDGVRVRAALSPARLGKLKTLYPEGFPGNGDGAP